MLNMKYNTCLKIPRKKFDANKFFKPDEVVRFFGVSRIYAY